MPGLRGRLAAQLLPVDLWKGGHDLSLVTRTTLASPDQGNHRARQRTGLTAAGITSVIARLAAGGHVVREIDPSDRRRAIIRAAEADHPEMAGAFAELGRVLGGVIAEYDPAERAAIASYLRRMVDILREQTIRLGPD